MHCQLIDIVLDCEDMKRIKIYITGSFFLMTLSAAAETWFSLAAKGHSVFSQY